MASYQWNIYLANLNPAQGSEQAGTRPILVVSSEIANGILPIVTIVPLTSYKGGTVYPNEVLLPAGAGGLHEDSIVLAYQVRTISKARLTQLLGNIASPSTKQQIRDAIKLHLDL